MTEKGPSTAQNSKVLACTCDHDFQNRWYGNGKRLHTIGQKDYTCTVCGRKTPIR